MKSLLFIFLMFSVFTLAQDDGKYIGAMKKNLNKIDTASSVKSLIKIANGFERIAAAEKDKWLPYYYSAMSYTLASFRDSLKEKKDVYLDEADEFIAVADSLEPNESEIYNLMGMIAQARMQVDPMARWQKYGAMSDQYFKKALESNSDNPRPEYLMGMNIYYTPEQFGGGADAAKPVFLRSKEKFESFESENDLMPNWGEEHLNSLLSEIEKQTVKNDTTNTDLN